MLNPSRFASVYLWIGMGCGCAAVQNEDMTSALHNLNGEHYQSVVQLSEPPRSLDGLHRSREALVHEPPMLAAVPERKASTLRGQAVVNAGLYDQPLKFQRVVLKQGGQVLLEATTDTNGFFEFSGVFRDGSYVIALESDRYRASREVTIERHELVPVQLIATPAAGKPSDGSRPAAPAPAEAGSPE